MKHSRSFSILLLSIFVFSAFASDELAPDEELYLQGAGAFDRGDFGVAATNFQLLLKHHPGSSLVCPTLFALAETYYSLQQYKKALSFIERITPSCAQTLGKGKVHWRRAWIFYYMDRLEEAKAAFRKAGSSSDLLGDQRSAALVMGGDVAKELGQIKEALASYGRVVRADIPISLACQVYLKIGMVNLAAANSPAAAQAFEKILQLDPKSEFADDALYGKAWARRKNNRFEAARVTWRNLIVKYPYSPLVPEARFRMGEEFYRMGKYPEAIMAFDSVSPSSDFADDALYWKAWAHYRIGASSEDKIGEYSKAAYTFGLVRTQFQRSPVAKDAQFRAAEAHREAGEFELALTGYRTLVEAQRSERYLIRSLYGIAQSAAMTGDLPNAENYRTQLLATGKAGDYAPRVFFDMGVAAYNRKQYSRAIGEFTSLLRQFPEHRLADEAMYELGLCYMREEMYQEAKETFGRCIRLSPAGDAGRNSAYQLAWAHFRAEEYNKSASQFLTVASRGGAKAIDARYRAGDAYYNGGRYDDAVSVYLQVIDLSPGSEVAAMAQNSIGWCYERLGKLEKAVGAFQTVVDRYPSSIVWDDSAYKVAEFYHANGDYSISVPTLEELRKVRISPFWESSILMLGEGLWQLGNKGRSLSTLEALLDRKDSPLRQDALLLMADNCWGDDRWEQAGKYYSQFADEFANSELAPRVLLRVAQSYSAQEMWREAVTAYTRAALSGAEPVACLIGKCVASANLGDCEVAEETTRSLEARFPANEETGEAQFWAGNCHFVAGDDEKAIKLLLKVPILYPDSDNADDALLIVARSRLRQGHPDKAQRQLRLLLDKYPASPLRGQAEKLLASVEAN